MPISIPETYSMYVAFGIDTDKFGISEEKKKEFNERYLEILYDDSFPDDAIWNLFDEIDDYTNNIGK